MSKQPTVPIVITKHYDLLLWLMKQVPKFPRSHKFLLGDRIQTQALDILECLIEAAYSKNKQAPLKKAGLAMETLRYLVRCAHDMEFLDQRPERARRYPCVRPVLMLFRPKTKPMAPLW